MCVGQISLVQSNGSAAAAAVPSVAPENDLPLAQSHLS